MYNALSNILNFWSGRHLARVLMLLGTSTMASASHTSSTFSTRRVFFDAFRTLGQGLAFENFFTNFQLKKNYLNNSNTNYLKISLSKMSIFIEKNVKITLIPTAQTCHNGRATYKTFENFFAKTV
jgi:hypothetical protein